MSPPYNYSILTIASAKTNGLIFKTIVSVCVTEKKKQKNHWNFAIVGSRFIV